MTSPFRSFFMAGFECSTHRRADGQRLDLIEATNHARHCLSDYTQARAHGLLTARDGIRWHLVESRPGRYDWSSFLPMLHAAKVAGVQVIWDLCHYGWPDDIDIWSADFVTRFAAFAGATAALARDEGIAGAIYCPVNEISYWAWAGAEVGRINPCARGRGGELKRQLVRSAVAATDAIRNADPTARIVYAEPAIHVVAQPGRPKDREAAEAYRRAQWEAWDLLSGRIEPELGGNPDYLDILGLNFYPDNQWYLGGSTIPCGHYDYRALRDMLGEVGARYGRPLVIAETGAERTARAAWLHYVADEVRSAAASGAPVLGVCLYPIVDYPGWDNARLCEVGLFGEVDALGRRPVYEPLARELARQFNEVRSEAHVVHRPSALPQKVAAIAGA